MLGQIWIQGGSRSGKTTALVRHCQEWSLSSSPRGLQRQSILVLAANSQQQRNLADLIHGAIAGQWAVVSKTPVAFMADEVTLFFPLIGELFQLSPQVPLRLRPELEQKYAREVWQQELTTWGVNLEGRSPERLVRRLLDLLQLAGAAGVPIPEIPGRLQAGQLSILSGTSCYGEDDHLATCTGMVGDLLEKWRDWCLTKGFLTYGIIYDLYWQYLLPHPRYQQHLTQTYGAVFADDVNDYPAIARDLLSLWLTAKLPAVFTANPTGQIRLGLNADPDYLGELAQDCTLLTLPEPVGLGINALLQKQLTQPSLSDLLPEQILTIQTISRAQLLEKVIAQILLILQDPAIRPGDIAIIAPGLDEVARYTLMASLAQDNIAVEPLQEQRPLYSSPWGRSPLTLLALIYPDCGRLIQGGEVAELLMMLSQTSAGIGRIDPVRAGLLVDYCYQPDPQHPRLLPANTMPRCDRLGYQVTTAYEAIRTWIDQAQRDAEPSAIGILRSLNRALATFYLPLPDLRYEQMAVLRELTETCQHFFAGDRRLKTATTPDHAPLGELIQMLQAEIVTANPRPQHSFCRSPHQAITLATIFQYRSARLHHKYQFWLDAGSQLWEKGGAATLFGYGLFQHHWDGEPWSPTQEITQNRQRLQQIIQDLSARTDQQIYLCHSDLGINGTEQIGPLYPLVQNAKDVTVDGEIGKRRNF